MLFFFLAKKKKKKKSGKKKVFFGVLVNGSALAIPEDGFLVYGDGSGGLKVSCNLWSVDTERNGDFFFLPGGKCSIPLLCHAHLCVFLRPHALIRTMQREASGDIK